jgi:tripartite-type tricarboxylate transporter receptor subunit TctC
MKKMLGVLGIVVLLLLGMAHLSGAAGEYPNRPITIISPYPPGGMTDMHARSFAQVAQKYLGQPLVVVTKPGAGGMIGAQAGAQAAPDGYTLTFTQTAITYSIEAEIAAGRTPPFTRDDFIPIGSFTRTGGPLYVSYEAPWKTMADFVKDCKAKPYHYKFGSAGVNGSNHLFLEEMCIAAGIKCVHVPFNGIGDVAAAVIGRHVDLGLGSPPVIRPLVEGKKLKALAVCTDVRLKSFPDLPTLREVGIDAVSIIWSGILAPKKTPDDIVKKLRDVAEKVAKDKEFGAPITKTGDDVYFMNGEELAKFWDRESVQVARVLQIMAKQGKEKESSK